MEYNLQSGYHLTSTHRVDFLVFHEDLKAQRELLPVHHFIKACYTQKILNGVCF